MRHFYDSIRYPFLGDLLFDQLLNFDWGNSRKEIEEEKKNLNKCPVKKDKEERQNYLRVLDDEFNKTLHFYSPTYELVDGEYVYKTLVPKTLKPKEIEISAVGGNLYFAYKHKTENGETSSASYETLPEDLDVNTLKAVLKNGAVTITAKKVEKKKKEESDVASDETEYEIEIDR